MEERPVSLREKLMEAKPGFRTVVMPDFFLDYILSYHGKLDEMTGRLEAVAKQGGGNLLGWRHTIGRGGKASNFAAQLGKLGAETIPILETDPLGHKLLSHFAEYLDLSHVKTDGRMSHTVSLESEYAGRRVNMMVSEAGSLSGFGPGRLTDDDRKLIRSADYVCLVGWNQLDKGTELAEAVYKTAREGGRAVTFFDPGDPSPRKGEIQRLADKVLTQGLVDVLSVNENELLQLASTVREEEFEAGEAPLFEAASVFSMLGTRVDLHTPEFSATFIDGQRVRVPCLKLDPGKVTGAGDAWNAGDVYAQGIGLDHKERLLFANATASAYVYRPDLEPAPMEEVLTMLERLEKTVQAAPSTVTSHNAHASEEEELDGIEFPWKS